jgi:hypothetical protein
MSTNLIAQNALPAMRRVKQKPGETWAQTLQRQAAVRAEWRDAHMLAVLRDQMLSGMPTSSRHLLCAFFALPAIEMAEALGIDTKGAAR